MGETDLKNLIAYLQSFDYGDRESTDLNDSLNFGLDMHYQFQNIKDIEKIFKALNRYYSKNSKDKFEYSYNKNIYNQYLSNNHLIVNTPVFTDTPEFYEELKDCLDALKEKKVTLNPNKGVHVHTDLSILENDNRHLLTLLKIITLYENIIFRFGFGESEKSNINLETYSKAVSPLVFKYIQNYDYTKSFEEHIQELQKILICKSYAINFHNKDKSVSNDTIEFRMFNGTFDLSTIQNYVNFVGNMMYQIVKDHVDLDVLDYSMDIYDVNKYTLDRYGEFDPTGAVELSEIVFDKREDQVRFLKQYMFKKRN
ncbi:MAG: amidoligase family protein [Bacilli bacterium]|nr:amidoligase family protein [Bacilli bacterium]